MPDATSLAACGRGDRAAAFAAAGLRGPEVWLEPGRSLVGAAGTTLYRVGAVKRLPERTWVAIDGGMSDNPRPQLYDARYTALSRRASEEPDEDVSVAGMHCESGDVLIDDVRLPAPRRGDLLAVPATGAYTLAMSSNYNGPAPGGGARARRRRPAHSPPRVGRRPACSRGVRCAAAQATRTGTVAVARGARADAAALGS